MTRWPQGEQTIEDLLDLDHLERVEASAEHAAMLIEDARRHVASANSLAQTDAKAAYSVMYDGVRKALSAILAKQGLRATSKGGHVAVSDAVRAQMGQASSVIAPFGGMRRRRHEAEYPSIDSPEIDEFDVTDALPHARAMIEAASKMVDVLGPWDS